MAPLRHDCRDCVDACVAAVPCRYFQLIYGIVRVIAVAQVAHPQRRTPPRAGSCLESR